MSLVWKLRRLSVMSPAEVLYRVRQRAQAGVEQFGWQGAAPAPKVGEQGAAWVAQLPRQFEVDKYRAAAEDILAGRFPVFAMAAAELGFPPDFNRDPRTGRQAPLVFGKTLNYRDEQQVGDIKYLWEPSRHAQLVTLAQAWHLTGEERYARGCATLLTAWFDQCPYPLGVHWTSSLEHAIRLVNWSFTWHLLGGQHSPLFVGEAGERLRERWLENIYLHCRFIDGHRSRHSSANNHLLGELLGLFIAAQTWPWWPRSRRWADESQRELEQQMLLQNAEDGVNREQANWYHHEVADMMLLAGLVARANGRDFTAAYWQRLRGMLDYIASIMDAGGEVPNFGDADDAIISRLDPHAAGNAVYRSLLASGAVVFGSAEFKFKAGACDDKTRWLFGDAADETFGAIDATRARLPVRRDFPQAGYYVLGSRFETPHEVRMVADAGPLGYLSIAAHGHADALSFTLSAGGRELLIDPGTYAYHTQKLWRDYFKGTSAHNTVRVDGMDQSVGVGNFLWVKHARAQLISLERAVAMQRWVGSHDGYRRLRDAVTHRRELYYEPDSNALQVIDELLCKGEHLVEIFWHFSEQCGVTVHENTLLAVHGDVLLTMTLPPGLECELRRGVEQPEPSGWISRSFDSKMPTTTAVLTGRISSAARFVTRLDIEFRA